MKKSLVAVSLALVLSACSNNATVEQSQNFAACTFPDSPKDEAPGWVCDVMPSDIGIAATGYAKKSAAGMSVMRKVAANEARVALASQFQIDVNNMFKQAVEASVTTNTTEGVNESVMETFENVTKTVVSRSLTDSRVLVSQVSPTGGLYVLVGMDQEAYKANRNSVIDAAGEDATLWNQFNNEQAADDLAKTLESLKQL
ncbi:LPP20 family lipoprotein [Enterovibrio makurazakiensis]|uniref:LPP20 family lipoprotein n=1 Tax=Enterovibrio gelatinilyticus TaxID=2899819 RepID=A0ABT5QZE4_9GAMM|nr:LPP20 family lipoprotein [Enterovibrio sp. ZSDZ42]MDD1793385.1 LPP20 family lipoprotein [Enterovibrio sp. ZSDZ42]